MYVCIVFFVKLFKNKTFYFCLISLFIGIYIGILGSTKPKSANTINLSPTRQNSSTSEFAGGQYGLINPLYECNVGFTASKEMRNLQDNLSSYIDDKIKKNAAKNISLYFRDLNNGPTFGINSSETFAPSSILKVPVMMAYYAKANQDPTILTKKITYDGNPSGPALLPQYYKPKNPLKKGSQYTIEQLIEKMIIDSDNNALSLLQQQIDSSQIDKITLDLEIPTANSLNPDNLLTVKDNTTLFRVLYNASYLDEMYSEKALELLTKVDFKNGIVAGVPSNLKIAHKFGERSYEDGTKQLHDCGIVYYPNHPYLICVMTKGTNFTNLEDVIKEISFKIYSEIDKKYH